MIEKDVLNQLTQIVGEENIRNDEPTRWAYSRDASFVAPSLPDVVVRPKNTEEIARIVRLANEHKTPVIPSGGRTSICGAGISVLGGGVLIDTARIDKIRIHDDEQHVSVGAGCTFSKLEYNLSKKNFTIGTPGPWTAHSATIGGGLSVNTLTIYGAPTYGSLPEGVSGLEVVLPNGEVIKTGAGGNPSNEAIMRYCNGPDMTGLFLGAHGTLGIITEATFKIYRRHECEEYFDVVFDNLEQCTSACVEIVNTGYAGLLMQFTGKFYRDLGLDPTAKGGGFHLTIFGSRENIDKRKEYVQRIISEYNGRKPRSLAPLFNARELAQHRHWCAVNGRWAEVCGFIETLRVNEFLRRGDDFLEEHKEEIDKHVIVPHIGIVYARHCADVFSLFLTYEPNEESITVVEKLRSELYEIFSEMGLSPYWIGQALFAPLPKKLANYYNFYKTIKTTLDPNNIINPGVLSDETKGEARFAP